MNRLYKLLLRKTFELKLELQTKKQEKYTSSNYKSKSFLVVYEIFHFLTHHSPTVSIFLNYKSQIHSLQQRYI